MQSLFPSASVTSSSSIVSFRAGKCILTPQPNGKFQVTMDLRRGIVTMTKSSSDGLVHFRWSPLNNQNLFEDDRVVFEGENEFKKVKTGRDTDRVYMLKYLSGNQRYMYWMQEKATDKDTEVVAKVNECIRNPNANASSSTAPTAVSPDDWMSLMGLNNNNNSASRQTLQTSMPSTHPNNNNNNNNSAAPTPSLDLSSILGSLGPPRPPANNNNNNNNNTASSTRPALTIQDLQRAMTQSTVPTTLTPPLQDIVNAEDVQQSGVLEDPEVVNQLLQLLPEEQRSLGATSVLDAVRSPQMRQALSSLSAAVQQGDNLSSVVSNFNLSSNNNTSELLLRGDGVGAFLSSFPQQQQQQQQEGNESKGGEEKKEEEKDRMEE